MWWTHCESGARAYDGGLGAEPQAGSWGRGPGQGVRGEAPRSRKVFSIGMSKRSGILALSGSFAVTAKPKLALCMAARAPKPVM